MGLNMAAGRRTAFNSFTCPNCQALYQIVKVEAGPETDSREIVCRVCGGPLAAREGKFILKYFLLRKGLRSRRRA
jgi:transcription elongation factor Elf1